MKIILLEDVKTLGKKGDVVEVSNGYARNMLLPRKLGIEATKKNMNDLMLKSKHREKLAQNDLDAAKAFAEELADKQVEIKVQTGTSGRIFGSVSTKDVATAAKEQLNLELDKKKMQLPDTLNEIGIHEVSIKLHPQVTAVLKVHVVGK